MKSPLLFDAIEFATKAHSGQFRKGSALPYIVHPLGVGKILIEHGYGEPVVISGLLHDTVEDTSVTHKDIAERFGNTISSIVEGLTEPDKKYSWEDRKRHTLEVFKSAPPDVLVVSCADKLDNLRSLKTDHARLGDEIWKRFHRPKNLQLWYFESTLEIFSARLKDQESQKLIGEISAEIAELFYRIDSRDRK
ncbi:MAG: bifunctional (p)ppGpp synthetase/guanosine-3',5'-bis(diphosphate) 3'-pyrophosphohydrolase [Chlorobiales bacterium]|nr:bifunctional (p)ppGpp synthetase/guanosine-3',5'-bis(diphosphate) 3'-pyrophosphohydrolase [Chlorobiales bacterium]